MSKTTSQTKSAAYLAAEFEDSLSNVSDEINMLFHIIGEKDQKVEEMREEVKTLQDAFFEDLESSSLLIISFSPSLTANHNRIERIYQEIGRLNEEKTALAKKARDLVKKHRIRLELVLEQMDDSVDSEPVKSHSDESAPSKPHSGTPVVPRMTPGAFELSSLTKDLSDAGPALDETTNETASAAGVDSYSHGKESQVTLALQHSDLDTAVLDGNNITDSTLPINSGQEKPQSACKQCRLHEIECNGRQPKCSSCAWQGIRCTWPRITHKRSTRQPERTITRNNARLKGKTVSYSEEEESEGEVDYPPESSSGASDSEATVEDPLGMISNRASRHDCESDHATPAPDTPASGTSGIASPLTTESTPLASNPFTKAIPEYFEDVEEEYEVIRDLHVEVDENEANWERSK